MTGIKQDPFDDMLSICLFRLKLHGANPDRVNQFRDSIIDKLNSFCTENSNGSPYGFIIIENPNSPENDLCPVYVTHVSYNNRKRYDILYCEHLVNGKKEIKALCIYPSSFPYDNEVSKNTSVFTCERGHERDSLLNKLRSLGYHLPDNAESWKKYLLTHIRQCYENHKRVSLPMRQFFRHYRYVVERSCVRCLSYKDTLDL